MLVKLAETVPTFEVPVVTELCREPHLQNGGRKGTDIQRVRQESTNKMVEGYKALLVLSYPYFCDKIYFHFTTQDNMEETYAGCSSAKAKSLF